MYFYGADVGGSYETRFSIVRDLDHNEETEYITDIDGEIFFVPDDENETIVEPVKVGAVRAHLIHVGLAMADGWYLYDYCDAHSQSVADYAAAVFDVEAGTFKDPLVDASLVNMLVSDLLAVHLIEIDPAYRGYHLGHRAMVSTIRTFGHDAAVICKPFPVQFTGYLGDPTRYKRPPWADNYPPDFDACKAKLAAYWRQLGFEPLPDDPEFLVLNTELRDCPPSWKALAALTKDRGNDA